MNTLVPISIVQQKNGEDTKVFDDFNTIFDCTNKTFFNGQLSCPVFSFSRNPRLKGAFLSDRYFSVDGQLAHGIVLNSDYARGIGDTSTIALLGFLVAQLARAELGPASKNGSHGTPGYVDGWTRDKLLSMGLEPFAADDEVRQLGYGLRSTRIISASRRDVTATVSRSVAMSSKVRLGSTCRPWSPQRR